MGNPTFDEITLPRATVEEFLKVLKPLTDATSCFEDEPASLEIELVGDDTINNPCVLVADLRRITVACKTLEGLLKR